ncbi:phosphoglycerate mutase [Mycena vulgaris]|nr:phosphoglycerate mutase [Mycena vulgaris]
MPAPAKTKVCLLYAAATCLLSSSHPCSQRPRWRGKSTEPGLERNAIEAGTPSNMDRIGKKHTQRRLAACGMAVGLWVTLKSGLRPHQCRDHDTCVLQKPTIIESFKRATEGNGRLHLLGLISEGGVHSHIPHLYALLEAEKEQGVPHTYVHFGDGRDTVPLRSRLLRRSARVHGEGGMDRDKRWDRIKIAIDGLVDDEGQALGEGKGVVDEIKANYEKEVTDKFLKPIIVNGDAGRIEDGDTPFLFNYRSDRMRELVSVLGLPDRPMEVDGITTISRHNADFPFHAALPPQTMINVLAEIIATHEIKQAHIAETEKYANPESAQAVADKVAAVARSTTLCRWTVDMVGHTGNFDAAVSAITHTGAAVGAVYTACQAAGYVLLVTTDHGNAE